MSIRPAVAEDADVLFGLLRQLATAFEPERGAFDTSLAELLERQGRDVLLLVVTDGGDDDPVLGYVLCTITPLLYTNGPAAQIHEIVVDEEARGRDYGTQLVRAVEGECTARGVRQLTVAARRAGGFYDRLGYTATAEFLKRRF